MPKEPQPPLGGMIGNEHFGHLADIEDPMEEEISLKKANLRKFQFHWRIWLAWYCWLVSCLEENIKFDNFLIRYINNVLPFRLYFINKISIYIYIYILFLICYLQIYGIVFGEFMWIITFWNIVWNSIIFIQKFYENLLKMVVNVFFSRIY